MTQEVPVLVINLDRSTDRWEQIQQRAFETGVTIERVPAVDGTKIPQLEWQDFDTKKFHLFHGRRPKGAEYGCYMSHIRALRIVVERDLPYALILEDDAGFLPGFKQRLDAILSSGFSFDALKLYNHRYSGFLLKHQTAAGDRIGRCIHGPLGSSMGYLVTNQGAKRLLRSLLPMFLPYDIALERGWNGGVEVYITRDPLMQPSDDTTSTIGSYRSTKFPMVLRIPTAFFRGQDYVRRTLYALRG